MLIPLVDGAPKRTLIQELHAQCPHGIIAVSDLPHLQTGHSAEIVVSGADSFPGDALTAAADAGNAGTSGTASGLIASGRTGIGLAIVAGALDLISVLGLTDLAVVVVAAVVDAAALREGKSRRQRRRFGVATTATFATSPAALASIESVTAVGTLYFENVYATERKKVEMSLRPSVRS